MRTASGLVLAALGAMAVPAPAATVRVATAANVEPALREIGPSFTKKTGHRIEVVAGATGKLTTQIVQGAPFDVFLAADAEHPEKLEKDGLAVAGSRFTYARGRLVLWTASAGKSLGAGTLRGGAFAHLAIADPETAPYGAAAVAVMRKLGVFDALEPKLVRGESVGQTVAFVKSGAAELGFVALSQLHPDPGGSRWLVPEELHAPLVQQAVLLHRAKDDPASRAFLAYLAGDEARATLRRFGYLTP
jgi:molybdate transport system substrate-binding protein